MLFLVMKPLPSVSEGNKHVEFIVDWLKNIKVEKEKNKNANLLNFDAIQQLNKTSVLLFIFQVTLIILFAVFGGGKYVVEYTL